MAVRLILIAIIAHLLGDFVFQTDRLIKIRFPFYLLNNKHLEYSIPPAASFKVHAAAVYLEFKKYLVSHNRTNEADSTPYPVHIALSESHLLSPSTCFIFKHTFKGNLIHTCIHGGLFILILILAAAYQKFRIAFNDYLGLLFLFCSFHFCIDQLKSILALRHPEWNKSIFFFLADQTIHLLSFILLAYIMAADDFYTQFNSLQNLAKELVKERILLISIIGLWMTFFAGIFIKIFMEYINHLQTPREVSASSEMSHGGMLIGILERLLILASMLLSYPQFIGYILTAKSIARLKKLDDARFAEYFLVGNLLSFLFGMIGGFLICFLIK